MQDVLESQSTVTISGQAYTEIPEDLFIPPDALEVLLDSFTGPLDLLLYLIRRQQIDIMDIPIVKITRQYMEYIEWMEQRRLELASDYLVMAAMLAEIKSRLLLPPIPSAEETIEEDPRMALVRRLQVYEQFKQAASTFDSFIRFDRDVFQVKANTPPLEIIKPQPQVTLQDLVLAMQSLLLEQSHHETHEIKRELLSVRERMVKVLACIASNEAMDFKCLFSRDEGRMGLVVSILAVLELAKQSLLVISQAAIYGPIVIKAQHNA